MENLPEFGDPNAPETDPQPPRKPRPKPVKKPMRMTTKQVIKVAFPKKRRKVVAKKSLIVSGTGLNVAQIIMAHAQIEALLAPLSKTERKAMLGMFNK